MVEEIFTALPATFVPQVVSSPVSYYFSLGECKKTVIVETDSCRVENGRKVDKADCVCKTSEEFFLKIWQDGYRPGVKDFLGGTIKSNNPGMLKDFLRAFGKDE